MNSNTMDLTSEALNEWVGLEISGKTPAWYT